MNKFNNFAFILVKGGNTNFHSSESNKILRYYGVGAQIIKELKRGERVAFLDQAHYTMVKTNTFNGVPLPSIALWNSKTDELSIIKKFDYEEFENRLS